MNESLKEIVNPRNGRWRINKALLPLQSVCNYLFYASSFIIFNPLFSGLSGRFLFLLISFSIGLLMVLSAAKVPLAIQKSFIHEPKVSFCVYSTHVHDVDI